MKRMAFLQSGVIGNILVAGFIWIYDIFIKPSVFKPEDVSVYLTMEGFDSPGVGFAVMAALILETVALGFAYIHIRQKQYDRTLDPEYVRKHPKKKDKDKDKDKDDKGQNFFFLLTIMHTAMSVLGAMIMLSAFNLTPEHNDLGFVGVVTLVVIRELIVWVLVINSSDDPATKPAKLFPGSRLATTLMLTFYCCVMYTVIWEPLVPNFVDILKMFTDIQDALTAIGAIVGGAAVILLCFVMYLPIRLGFYWEESLIERTPEEKRWFYSTIAITVLSALIPKGVQG